MRKEEQGDLSESILESRDQVDQLITQGKIEEAMEIIEEREKEEGIEELRWRVLESKCRKIKGEYEKVIEITEEIEKQIEELGEKKGEQEKRVWIDALIEQVWALQRMGRLDEGLKKVEKGLRLIDELEKRTGKKEEKYKDLERKANLFNNKGVICKQKGELDEALVIYTGCLEIYEEIGDKRGIAASLNNIGEIYRRKGVFDQALVFHKQSLLLKEELGIKLDIASSLNNLGVTYYQIGELDQALEYYKKTLVIKEEVGNKQDIATSLNNIGIIYYQKGELVHALEYYKKSLVMREEVGNKQAISHSLNNIGIIYHQKGELNQALIYYDKSLSIKEDIGNKQDIANSLSNIGVIYRMKGELGQALEYFEKSLVMREAIGNKQDVASSLSNIGSLYQEMGELEEALSFLKKSLVLRKEIGNKLEIANSLFNLISVTIDLDVNQARDYLSDLQLINEQEENKQVDLRSRLADALILKTSKRRKNLTKAEEALEKIVGEEVINHELTATALVNLSELLLEELLATGEEEILEEVEEKVEILLEIAKKQQSYILIAKSYWLKAQLALVRLDLYEARNLMSQAQVIAEEKGLERLARKISSEHDQLLEQLDRWEELIAKDASITERVKVANLEELMGWMARKREIKIDEKEDEPVMLLLVAESGLPIYSKKFDETKELQDMLISGFLTSINAFVREAFEVKGVIRRIMHDEYTLSFEVIEPVLFCYVYEGQSYTAMKKLERLTTEVHESEVWSVLEKVGKKGYGLTDEAETKMEGVIGEIFLTN